MLLLPGVVEILEVASRPQISILQSGLISSDPLINYCGGEYHIFIFLRKTALFAGGFCASPRVVFMNPFTNPRPSLPQIESTPSSHDGISSDLELSLRSHGAKLIQSCGILLKLYSLQASSWLCGPQSTIATAMVLFQRFYYVASFRQHALKVLLAPTLLISGHSNSVSLPSL